jgi:hypothetical protein
MRVFALIIIVLAVLGYFAFTQGSKKITPDMEAVNFVTDIRRADLLKIVHHFGKTCHCPLIRGSYLVYRSGQEPNLAFLVGRPFGYDSPKVEYVNSDKPDAQTSPENTPKDAIVDITLGFDPNKYAPFFLPLPLAYGRMISASNLHDFVTNPDENAWKGFTLRLRPGLKPGSITVDEQTIGQESWPQFRALEDRFSTFVQKDGAGLELPGVDQKMIKETLGESSTQFLVPQDTGNVQDESRKTLPYQEVQKVLPRLKSVVLRLHLAQVGEHNEWTIDHFTFHDAIVTTGTGTQKINCERPRSQTSNSSKMSSRNSPSDQIKN